LRGDGGREGRAKEKEVERMDGRCEEMDIDGEEEKKQREQRRVV
jgi:hypothetical protein